MCAVVFVVRIFSHPGEREGGVPAGLPRRLGPS